MSFCVCLFGVIAFVVIAFVYRLNNRFYFLIFLLLFMAGYIIPTVHNQKSKMILGKYFDEYCIVCGTVDDIKEYAFSTRVFINNCYISAYGDEETTEKLPSGVCLVLSDDAKELHRGDTIRALGALSVPDSPTNPGQFDYASYYDSIGYRYCLNNAKILQIEACRNRIRRFANTVRERIKAVYLKVCDQYDYGIFSAMVLGDKNDLNSNIKELFSNSGIGHILAISGLHISIIGMGLYKLLRKLKMSYPVSALVGATFVIFYGMMAGNPLSAVRAIIMFVCAVYANVIGRAYDILSAVCLAGIILLLSEPHYLINCGFLLSFLAIFGIVVVSRGFTKEGKSLLSGFIGSLSIQLATLPVMLWFYYEIPTYSCFLNILVVPLMTVVMISACLTGLVGVISTKAAMFFVGPGHYLLALFRFLAEKMLGLYGSTLLIGRPNMWRIVLYVVLILLFSLRREIIKSISDKNVSVKILLLKKVSLKDILDNKWFDRCVGVLFLVCAVLSLTLRINHGLKVVFLDVGQGDGIFIAAPNGERLFIDGGSSSKKEVYKNVIEPFLRYEGVKELDYLFVTHNDDDHYSGWKEWARIRQNEEKVVKINKLMLNEVDYSDYMEAEKKNRDIRKESNGSETINIYDIARSVDCVECAYAGRVISLEDMKITSLNGSASYDANHDYDLLDKGSENDDSIVLLFQYEGINLLMCGDLGEERESVIASRLKLINAGAIEVLKVAHHGSKYSTSEAFLDTIMAKNAIISCSYSNSYGHPHEEVIERLNNHKVESYYTMKGGAIIFHINSGGKINKSCFVHNE